MIFIECTARNLGKCLINTAQILGVYSNNNTTIILHADGRGTEVSESYEDIMKKLEDVSVSC